MSKKSPQIAKRIESFQGQSLPAHYLGFFHCFNHQEFYEAHDVLEDLWLPDRKGPDGNFYKGLIQLAGAFVHVQKNRPGPAVALLRLARNNLELYPAVHHQLDLGIVMALIENWRLRLDGLATTVGIFEHTSPPSWLSSPYPDQGQSCPILREGVNSAYRD